MKYFHLLILTILITACGSNKEEKSKSEIRSDSLKTSRIKRDSTIIATAITNNAYCNISINNNGIKESQPDINYTIQLQNIILENDSNFLITEYNIVDIISSDSTYLIRIEQENLIFKLNADKITFNLFINSCEKADEDEKVGFNNIDSDQFNGWLLVKVNGFKKMVFETAATAYEKYDDENGETNYESPELDISMSNRFILKGTLTKVYKYPNNK
jgi:hypothetical protein